MALFENWGFDLQLFAEGQEKEPVSPEPEKTDTGAGENQSAETGKENKNEEPKQDPIEILRKKAEELGIKDFMLLTPAEIDRKITQAIKTREEKLKKQQEIEEMKKKGEFEKLLRQERKEYLEDILTEKLETSGLAEIKEFISIEGLIDIDKNDAKKKINEIVEGIVTKINETVEKKVAEKVKELEKGSYVSTSANNIVNSDDPKEMLKQLFNQRGK